MKFIKIIPMVFLFLYGAKYLVLEANSIDASIIAILAIFTGVYEFINFRLKSLTDSEELDDLKKKLVDLEKGQNEIKTHLSGLQLGSQARFSNVKR